MKHFGLDWGEVLAALPAWGRLSPAERELLLERMKPAAGANAAGLGAAAAAAALGSGFAERGPKGTRLLPRPENRAFLVLLRALDRQRIWENPTPTVLADYLKEHFNGDEVAALTAPSGGHGAYGYADRTALAHLAATEEWVQEFLDAATHPKALEWERRRLLSREEPRFARAEVWEAARKIVVALLALPGPVPLRELPGRFAGVEPAVLMAALEGSLRCLLLFCGVRDGELEPLVGPWPEVAARLGAGPPPLPAPVEAVSGHFEGAWLMEDFTAVLVAAAGEGVRLRGTDGRVFARAREALERRLLALPAWLEDFADEDPASRVEVAAALLPLLGLARRGGTAKEPRLEATKEGTKWLALSERDRLAALLDRLRASPERNPPSAYDGPLFPFFGSMMQEPVRKGAALDLRADLTRLFLGLPDGYVGVGDFLLYAGRAANPFLALLAAGKAVPVQTWGRRPSRRIDWERMWGEIVGHFFLRRLAALGGARLGLNAEGKPCFALTGAGRYLLGDAGHFEYGHAAEAEVIVQPNFEVVFLAPSPRTEAALARFAERVGAGAGVMFRLTRASVLGAAEAGIGEAQVIEALRAASSRDLPANVVRQVRDWMGAVRRVRLRPAVLVECPDAETAGRVRGAAGKGVRVLTETVLEFPPASGKDRSALLRKLRAAGVFVE